MTTVQPEEISEAVAFMRSIDGPVLSEINANKGGRRDLERPTRTPIQNKKDFMHFLAIVQFGFFLIEGSCLLKKRGYCSEFPFQMSSDAVEILVVYHLPKIPECKSLNLRTILT